MREKYHLANDAGIIIWNVSSILEDINDAPEKYALKEVVLAKLGKDSAVKISRTWAIKADLTKPCIIAELAPEKYLLIDGNHRLYKARLLHRKALPCYVLTREQQQHFIMHFRPAEYDRIVANI